jgi:HPt (histidine-containing phosphotransfer) domain-containing protein
VQDSAHKRDENGLLDLRHLARCSASDPDLERELLTLYMEQAGHQLRIIVHSNDANSVRQALHTLKGCALAVGLPTVASAAAELESTGFDPPDEARIAALEAVIEAAEKSIRHYLK